MSDATMYRDELAQLKFDWLNKKITLDGLLAAAFELGYDIGRQG
jgi:hypothetical protein